MRKTGDGEKLISYRCNLSKARGQSTSMQPSCIHFYALLILVISMLSVPIHFCIISSRAIDLTVWVPLNFCFEATGTLCTSESSVLYIGLACVATTSTPVPHIDIVGLI